MRASQTHDSYWRGILQRKNPRSQTIGFVEEALNIYFPGGVPTSRPGFRPFIGAPLPADVKGTSWHVTEDGHRQLLVAAGNRLFRCQDGGDPIELGLDELPSTKRTRSEPERVYFLSLSGGTNTTFIYDGVNPNLKWDGAVLTQMGINTPPTPHNATSILSHGSVNKGTRNLVQTLVTDHHESSPSETPREQTFNSVGNTFTVASPTNPSIGGGDIDDPQVQRWRIYMTVAGGAEFRFVDEADIGVDIVVDIKDTDLAERNLAEFFTNDPPPAAAIALTEHRGQLAGVFADDANLVRFSNLDPDFMVPEGWPADFVQPVAHGDGDELTALASQVEWLMCYKNTAAFAIVGATFDEYKVVPVVAAAGGKRIGLGVFSPGTVLQVENALFFVARDGIYRIDRFSTATGGLTPVRLSGAIDSLFSAAKFSLGASTFFDRIHRLFGFLGHG